MDTLERTPMEKSINVIRFSALKSVSTLAAFCALAACVTPSKQPVTLAGNLQASWVVLGEQGQAIARAITLDTVCPMLLQDGQAQRMQVRAMPTTVAQRKTTSLPHDSKPAAFPVLSCEAVLNPASKSVSVDQQVLSLPKSVVRRIVVIGDTGCRLQKSSDYFQDCNDAAKWAFPEVAKTAASFKPDLVIHVGDYHYRENACDARNSDCTGSPWGYGWDTWQADFFSPAAALLAAAPWVVVRGNHESCSRAGQGWWRFMDPRPLQAGRDCNREQDDLMGDYSAPYTVPLGRGGAELAQLIIFDSAKMPYKALSKTDPAHAIYLAQLQEMGKVAAQADFNFFIDHHPILGLGPLLRNAEGVKIFPGNAALQDLLQGLYGPQLFPPEVQATIGGHVHLFEAISFASGHPTQFVSGNGGSSLDQPLPTPLPPDAKTFSGAKVAQFMNTNEVGFMTMERIDASWKIQAWNKNGKLLNTCLMQERKTSCSVAD
jgi:hypothetical protein